MNMPAEIQKNLVNVIIRHFGQKGADRIWIDARELREIYDLPLSYVPILTNFLNYLYHQTWGKSRFPFGVTARREVEGNGRLQYIWEVQKTI
ncbi:MAG: hypothetical protein QMD46_11785 [Methanomicrobiales archaeon]|nr:hypothetical protein [Methanomicrobiales archaeon]MDI6877202.1 hypothetical protein [Methanomicrobiales archaeon]